jgi:hypothetical protein
VPPKESSVLKAGEHEDDNDVITACRLPFCMKCFTSLEKNSVIAEACRAAAVLKNPITQNRMDSAHRHLSLTLANLGGVGESVLHTAPDMAWNFHTVSVRPRHERNLMGPYFAAYSRDGIAEGEHRLWIPRGGSRLELSRLGEIVYPEGDEGEQAEQARGGAQDRLVGPLALGLDAEMGADFLGGDLDLPTADESGEDVAWDERRGRLPGRPAGRARRLDRGREAIGSAPAARRRDTRWRCRLRSRRCGWFGRTRD